MELAAVSRQAKCQIKAVAFDAFGTLVEIGDKRRPYARLAAASVAPLVISPMTEAVSLEELAEMCGIALSPADLLSLKSDLDAELASIVTYPEAISVLEALRDSHLLTAVASNLAQPYAAPVQARLGKLLDASCLSFEVGSLKPSADFYGALIELLGLKPEEILMVGDSWRSDYMGATACGISALHLDRGNIAQEHQRAVSIRNLGEVLAALNIA